MLQNIRIVLVETSHTGNMGSVARAMKTMGLTNLWLVNPLVKPDSQAIALAAGASDVIGNAQIVDTLDEALAGCSLVVGTSARSRTLPWPMLDPRECGLKSVSEAEQAPVALVFGRERVGLTNDELQKCHYHVAIAANPEYSSLNLAMAVQVISYEVRMVGAPACGDVMKLQIKVNNEGIIEDARFKTYGCGSAIASSSLVTEWVKGKSLDEAQAIKNTDIAEELELPPVKIHCSILAEDAIKAAIADYKSKREAK